jgi:integrase
VQHLLELARTEWGYPLSGNPFDHVILPAPGKARTRRVEPPELIQLLEGCGGGRSPLLEPIIRFAVETGMRRSELVNVRWQHINFLNRTLHIPMTKNGHARTIPLSSEAIRVLRVVQERKFDPDRVFPLSPNAVRLAWVRLTKRTGVIGLCFHDLRHEAISRFFEKGLNMPEVALISGHRDMRMLHRYTHLRAEDVAKKLS